MALFTNNATYTIQHGYWVNWSHGRIIGSQITLSGRDAQILSSFLSVFITVVGIYLWQIFSFVVHQVRASDKSKDVNHHQIQVELRNTTSPWTAAKAFFQQYRHWRSRTTNVFTRTIPWAIVALVYALSLAVFSVFAASLITQSPGNARLVKGAHCGFYAGGDAEDAAQVDVWAAGTLRNSYSAADYARSCYPGNDTTSVVSCNAFPTPHLRSNQSHISKCPFEDSICIKNNSSPLQLDTGFIDSALDLGINTPRHQRVQYRKVVTCSPVTKLDYSETYNVTEESEGFTAFPGDQLIIYYLGPTSIGSDSARNYTFYYNTHTPADLVGYSTDSFLAKTDLNDTLASWKPIPALNRTDADISLMTIQHNSITHRAQCADPVFNASTRENSASDNSAIGWETESYVGSIGCAEQHQLCNPSNGKCSELTSQSKAVDQGWRLGLNTMQVALLPRIFYPTQFTTMDQTVKNRGASALRAQEKVKQLFSDPLPSNQWEIEVVGWFQSSLARLQQEVQQYATWASDDNLTRLVRNDNSIDAANTDLMCQSQLTLNTQGTQSFSMLGLGVLLVLGTLIIIIANTIQPIVAFAQHKFVRKNLYRYRDWVLTEKLQLHRMALAARSVGPWRTTIASIPTTEEAVLFPGWVDSDLENAPHDNGPAGDIDHQGVLNSSLEEKPFIPHTEMTVSHHTSQQADGSREDVPSSTNSRTHGHSPPLSATSPLVHQSGFTTAGSMLHSYPASPPLHAVAHAANSSTRIYEPNQNQRGSNLDLPRVQDAPNHSNELPTPTAYQPPVQAQQRTPVHVSEYDVARTYVYPKPEAS